MIKHYDLTENDVSAKPYEAEALYYCNDTKNVYFDSPTKGHRIKMSSDVIIIGTESERESILAPIADKIYIVLDSGAQYIYSSGVWVSLSKIQFEIPNIKIGDNIGIVYYDDSRSSVEIGTTIIDNRIMPTYTAEFIPDPTISDMITSSSVICKNGYAYIKIACKHMNYTSFTGRLLVHNKKAEDVYDDLIYFHITTAEEEGAERYGFGFKEGMTFDEWVVSVYNNMNDVFGAGFSDFHYDDDDGFYIDAASDNTYQMLIDHEDGNYTILDRDTILKSNMELRMIIF